MASAKFETLLPEVAPHAIGCPELTMINAIRNAVYELCSKTLCLTQDFDPISVTVNEETYTIDAASGMEVVQTVGPVYYDGTLIYPFSDLGIERLVDWRTDTAEKPTAYTCFIPGELTLYPIPTVALAGAITGRVALTPTRTSTAVEDWVLTSYRTELAAGALSAILMLPGQIFSNPQLALFYRKIWNAAIGDTSAAVRTGFMAAPIRVRFPGF